jgi:hypothetical protein
MTPTDNHQLITGQERREKRRQTEGLSAGWIVIADILGIVALMGTCIVVALVMR